MFSYEEASVYTSPNTEQKPNFGDTIPPRGAALAAAQKAAREHKEHMDENRRYGEAISEHGFGGETMGITHTTTSNTGGGVGGGGSVSVSSGDAAGEQTHRHGSYETSPEVEERELKRDLAVSVQGFAQLRMHRRQVTTPPAAASQA
ncbi:hypothetical protein V500_10699 [Pseudogymnoascus sp. VKM F-4518 (FW-2643)]|nr:hypothetical protein V500_10699 [Pseudogymnoascus sp. VKM F-4518 (FW-2643)]